MIKYFKMEIYPLNICGKPEKKLEIRVNVDGIESNYHHILYPDDLKSFYDQFFEMVKERLRCEIEKAMTDN